MLYMLLLFNFVNKCALTILDFYEFIGTQLRIK